MKNYYELLEITPTASPDEIKRAFRQQIARYHPDKVQHLGKEFQAMAADRAAELTESYRILSDANRRAEYDKARAADAPAAAAAGSSHTPSAPPPEASAAANPRGGDHSGPSHGAAGGHQFVEERASRDEFVRKATISRFRQAFAQVAGASYDESPVRGFDIACAPKAKLFARAKGPRLLGRFVPRVDSEAVADAWAQAGKLNAKTDEEICVFLMGAAIAPQRELATAIAEQRRRAPRGGKVTLIPVNASVWDAHLPTDAPAVAKDLLARLRSGG